MSNHPQHEPGPGSRHERSADLPSAGRPSAGPAPAGLPFAGPPSAGLPSASPTSAQSSDVTAPADRDPDVAAWLAGPVATVLAAIASEKEFERSAALRSRLVARLAASRAAASAMTTVRHARQRPQALTTGVRVRTLYSAESGRPLRPGEPMRVLLIELDPEASFPALAAGLHREWLVLRGSAMLGSQPLAVRDYHVDPAGSAAPALTTRCGAMVFLRESAARAQPGDAPFTLRDDGAAWSDFAPGIRRRVLWQRHGEAAMLYHAQPGASVPDHDHGHDEECLMVEGELFLDDVLLQPGDYQLAPAGTRHRVTETDTGALIYAHGDLDLRLQP